MSLDERPAVRVGVLGPLVVERECDAVDIGGPKTRSVFVTLVHHLDEVVRVDTLVEALWGATPPKSARNAIQVNVSHLRRALGVGVDLRTEPSGYLLGSAGAAFDVAEFEALAESAAALLHRDPATAADLARRATRLWRGLPVASELDIEPLRQRLVALDELHIGVRTTLIDAQLRLGDHHECCAEAAALADEHPFREDLRARHMIALYHSGRQTEALAAYREARKVLIEDLGVEPGPLLRTLHRQILQQDDDLDLSRTASLDTSHGSESPAGVGLALPTSNLRPEPNAFVERPEILEVTDALEPGRVVTAVGAGGIGKSRCVAAAARRCLHDTRFTDGVWIIDLAPLPEDSEDVAATVAAGLRLGQQPEATSTQAVVGYLAHRHALLVLDNCEHVLSAAAVFVHEVLAGAPSTTFLCASRVRLGVPAERVVTVDRLPDTAALALFQARAAEAGTGPFGEEACAELCAVLDNYPLAIELAAARSRALGPSEIVDRLTAQPYLLGSASGGRRDVVDPRHSDLTAALDWSYAHLSDRARGTLDAATVFVSDFDLRSAELVLASDSITTADVLDDIGELVEHHLVHRDHGRARFRILEPIRQHRRPAEPGRSQRRYVEHFAAFAIDAAVGLRGPDEAIWWDRIHADLAHVREAVRLAIDAGNTGLLDSVMAEMAVTSWICAFTEPGEWATDALRRLQLDPVRAPGVAVAAAVHFAHLEMRHERDALLERLESTVEDPALLAVVYCTRSFCDPLEPRWHRRFRDAAAASGDPAIIALAELRNGTREAVAFADRHGNPTLRVNARQFWSAAQTEPLSAAARRNREELYGIALASNNSKTIAEGQMFMALQHCYDQEPRHAGALAVEMIERLIRLRSPFWVWHGVEVIGIMLAMLRIEPMTSETLWASVTASGRTPFSRVTRRPHLPEWVASQLTDDERQQAIAIGSTLDMDAAGREARKAAERMAGA